MEPTIEKCCRMMDYLKKQHFIIPHYNLKLPEEADGKNYRSDKIFELVKYTGLLHYRGWDAIPRQNPNSMDINHYGITPPKEWIVRAYLFLIDEVRVEVLRRSKNAEMKNLGELMLHFNHLDFVDLPNE